MAAKTRKKSDAPTERCILCQLSDELNKRMDRHSGVLEHLTNAKREVLEAVREFVDNELDSLEEGVRRLRKRKRGKRVTKVEVE